MRIGIDLGGTKIEIAVLDDAGNEVLRRRIPSPAHDYPAVVAAIGGLVLDAERELGQRCSVGVGTPGSLSLATGLIKGSNNLALNGRPLKEDLERVLSREIHIENDANCFTLSEAIDGAAAKAPIVFGVILGTGVGGGVCVNGRALKGVNSIAGEWGHNPLPRYEDDLPLPPCNCGRFGCIEAYLSGPALARQYAQKAGMAIHPVEIVKRAAAGEALAEACLERYESRLARALAMVINIVDPHVIVLGGGMSNSLRLYTSVPTLWVPHVFSDRIDTRLVKNMHGDSSGVRGAAWLW